MSTNRYFESIGMWPHTGKHMERTYVIGFLLSLVLTLVAYVAAVYEVLPPVVLVPFVLILAAGQFIVQVLNFLHLSGESSSRERLVALVCTAVIMLILVLGSMWIMTKLDSRMMPGHPEVNPDNMEMYMVRETGI